MLLNVLSPDKSPPAEHTSITTHCATPTPHQCLPPLVPPTPCCASPTPMSCLQEGYARRGAMQAGSLKTANSKINTLENTIAQVRRPGALNRACLMKTITKGWLYCPRGRLLKKC